MIHKEKAVEFCKWKLLSEVCRYIQQFLEGLLSMNGLIPFPKYVEYQQSVTVYKRLNVLNPHYMNKLFSYTQENHSYDTRNATSSLLALPKCNKSIGQKCISYSGPKVWNGSTEAIRYVPSFKSRYLKAMYCTTL